MGGQWEECRASARLHAPGPAQTEPWGTGGMSGPRDPNWGPEGTQDDSQEGLVWTAPCRAEPAPT